MLLKSSFTTIVVGVFVVYVVHTCWVMYGIVYTKPCEPPSSTGCITPFLAGDPELQVSNLLSHLQNRRIGPVFCDVIIFQMSIYTALWPNANGGHTLIHKEENFNINEKFERSVDGDCRLLAVKCNN